MEKEAEVIKEIEAVVARKDFDKCEGCQKQFKKGEKRYVAFRVHPKEGLKEFKVLCRKCFQKREARKKQN